MKINVTPHVSRKKKIMDWHCWTQSGPWCTAACPSCVSCSTPACLCSVVVFHYLRSLLFIVRHMQSNIFFDYFSLEHFLKIGVPLISVHCATAFCEEMAAPMVAGAMLQRWASFLVLPPEGMPRLSEALWVGGVPSSCYTLCLTETQRASSSEAKRPVLKWEPMSLPSPPLFFPNLSQRQTHGSS